MDINVRSGYVAVNLSSDIMDESTQRWIGVIQGNIYCKKTHKNVKFAVSDAKKLYDKLIE